VLIVAVLATALFAQASSGLSAAELEQRLNAYAHLLRDWAGLTRYGSENAELPRPAAGVDRVVFFGDQITEAWGRSADNPVGGWYGLKRGLRGRFGMYMPPLLEALGLAEVEHNPKNNRMRAL